MSESYLRQQPQKYLMDGCKIFWHQDKLEDFLRGYRISPVTIDMGIAKSCNIHCVYCYGIKQGKSSEYIPLDRLLMLADDARDCGVRSIAIIGDGEPTMNKGLYPFVEALKKNGVQSAVATNGLLLNEYQIECLVSTCTWVRFNISGVSNYDWVMGAPKGSLAKFEDIVLTAVQYASLYGCTIGLQMVLIPECFEEIIPLAKKAVEWGVDYLVIKQFSDGGEGMPMHLHTDYDKAREALHTAEGMSNEKTKIIPKWNALSDTVAITRDKHWGFDRCIDLPFLFQISGNGECYPCGYLFGNPEYCYGNVREQRLADILKSERYWEIVDKVGNTPLEQLCKGQCRHCEGLKFMDKLNKIYTGDLHKALVEMCGSEEQYEKLMRNPPEHREFI
jgi:MoaA/NifB/PqqE/SkfB family radical SAM enzyme